MNSTERRVPRITGLPARTPGSTTMRSLGGMPTVYRASTRFWGVRFRHWQHENIYTVISGCLAEKAPKATLAGRFPNGGDSGSNRCA